MMPILECVPNISEGRDPNVIRQIVGAVTAVEGVHLLHVDTGESANRTVITFAGQPAAVTEAAFQLIKKAAECIDMQTHTGIHPRMGATDVCPLIPINGMRMEEAVEWAKKLGKRVGGELEIPVYLYEYAASQDNRKNLATIRSGEYEGFREKIKQVEWRPDFGPARFNPKAGQTVIGARDFLVAYNINLETDSVEIAKAIAADIRESGRMITRGGKKSRQAGSCKSVKAIGWYVEEYGFAQVSTNLTRLSDTPLHVAFEATKKSAQDRGTHVRGSEIIGLVPLHSMLEAGRFYQQKTSSTTSSTNETELIQLAIQELGLDQLAPFNPKEKIIEYILKDAM